MTDTVSSAAVKGSTPTVGARLAARPLAHCISDTPRNMAMVSSDMARPRSAGG